MNGVLEWRNENRATNYPLVRAILDPDLLVDARLTAFDGFIPSLHSYGVAAGVLRITLTLEKGNLTVELPAGTPEGARIPVVADRNYGVLVAGPGVPRLLAAPIGQPVIVKVPFCATCVVYLPSRAGVYELAGMRGDITLRRSRDLLAAVTANSAASAHHRDWTGTANYLRLDAISLPSKQRTVQLAEDINLVYGVTDRQKLVKIDTDIGSLVELADLDRTYQAVASTPEGLLFGVAAEARGQNVKLYQLNQIPAVFLKVLSHPANGLHYLNGLLYLAGDGISTINPNTLEENFLGTLGSLADPELPYPAFCSGDLTQGRTSSALLMTLIGTRDKDPDHVDPAATIPLRSADRLAEFDTLTGKLKVIGEVTASVPRSLRTGMSGVYGLCNTATKLFGWTYFLDSAADPAPPIEGNLALSIDRQLAVATVLHNNAYDPLVGKVMGLTRGQDAEVVLNNFRALKSLNGQRAVRNALVIEDSSLLHLTNTGPGELTLAVPDIAGLQLNRSTQYS